MKYNNYNKLDKTLALKIRKYQNLNKNKQATWKIKNKK
jgi:hypothetical protein